MTPSQNFEERVICSNVQELRQVLLKTGSMNIVLRDRVLSERVILVPCEDSYVKWTKVIINRKLSSNTVEIKDIW